MAVQRNMFGGDQGTMSIKRRLILFTSNVIIVVVYLIIGGVCMKALERPLEEQRRIELEVLLSDLELNQTQKDLLMQYDVCEFETHGEPKWTLSGSIFYSMTVITTIGYGSFAPSTYNGKSFTVLYGFFGISIIGQLLASCAGILIGVGKALAQRALLQKEEDIPRDPWREWSRVWNQYVTEEGAAIDCFHPLLEALTGTTISDEALFAHIKSEIEESENGLIPPSEITRGIAMWFQSAMTVPKKVSWKSTFGVILASACWILCWGFLFSLIEGWKYRESLWFCFITLSTIGFGDFTPETKIGRGLSFLFIIPGLGLGAASLGTIWDVFESYRFWCLQGLMKRGLISRKVLEAHDIPLAFKTRGRSYKFIYPKKGGSDAKVTDPTLATPFAGGDDDQFRL
eukprot:TRINITY_DN3594_c4_g1_i1.p1 TRINITY_DN3594_c4_g1~~TRINITY_DN3594_c4_g1_i1.p1  ORF type:complete len:400 (+),score=71.88 TRINITY_DN3594_c4_g1_i1:43-1242(+)